MPAKNKGTDAGTSPTLKKTSAAANTEAVKAYERSLALMPTGPAAAAVKLDLMELRP